jgi:hypothetical protein
VREDDFDTLEDDPLPREYEGVLDPVAGEEAADLLLRGL